MAKINKDSIDKFYDYDLELTTRTVYIGSVRVADSGEESGVDAHMSERAIKALHLLEAQAPGGDKPITIILNNPGGDWYHGMSIYDAIKACKNHITIKVFGYAMSMGSLILQAGDDRILAPNSRVMIHHGQMGMDYTHNKIFYKWADEVKRLDKDAINIYLEKIQQKHPDYTAAKVDKLLDFDTILSAQEAIDLGLADKLLV